MTFRVGQKVVCVDAKKRPHSHIIGRWDLVRGQIYTIRNIEIWMGIECVRLNEIVEPAYEFSDRGWLEPSWHAARFRPIVERKTDISIFKKMLTPAQEPACISS